MTDKKRIPTTFPSNAHRIAWFLGASLLPFEAHMPDGLSEDEACDLETGQRSLHAFLGAVYADMYQNPSAYRMAEVPDLCYEDGEWTKDRPDVSKIARRNAHVLKSMGVLYRIGRRARLRGDDLVLRRADWDAILDGIVPKSISRPKTKGFIQALARHGLEMSGEDELTLRAPSRAKMLVALKTLCHGDDEEAELRAFALQRGDFQAVEAEYTPDLSRVFSVLPSERRELVERIVATLDEAGYQRRFRMSGYPSAIWSLEFSGVRRLKAGPFLTMGYSIMFRHRFYLRMQCINPQHLIPLVYAKSAEYKRWFDSLWRQDCTGCGYCVDRFKTAGPYRFEVEGVVRGLCHQNWITRRDPTPEQVDDLLGMVALHTEAGLAP